MANVEEGSCACRVCAGIRVILDQIFRVLDVFGWLLDAYIVDFFEENLWSKLPGSWRIFLESITLEELGAWLLGESHDKRIWPLSLLTLRRIVGILEINRNHEGKIIFECCNKQLNKKDCHLSNLNITKISDANVENACTVHPKLQNFLMKRVKLKKRHEIKKIAQITAKYASVTNCKCIVDIGAGMGHLARVLAYEYGLHIICVEQQPLLSEQARKCDAQLQKILRYVPNFIEKKPHHVSTKVDASDYSRKELMNCLMEAFKSDASLNSNTKEFGLVGLHPCGDLAATLLKFYFEQDKARFICIAGCCYMKLTLQDTIENPKGYPLSKYLLKRNDHRLSYAALEVACHAIENYCDKLKTGKYEDLMVHAYRAALESLLVQKNAKLRHVQLRSVKLKKDTTFQQYCQAATEYLKPEEQPSESDFTNFRVIHFLNRWQQVIVFGSFRFMLAPLIETVVLLDRFLFLSERNLTPRLKPEFDSRLSPRNFVLTSVK